MKFSKEDYIAMYEARYSPLNAYKNEDEKSIVWGTFVSIFQDYRNDFISYLAFIPDLLFNFLPTVTKKLWNNFCKPKFDPRKHFKLNRDRIFANQEDVVVDNYVKERENRDSLDDKYYTYKEDKLEKAEALSNLRKYLYLHNLTLEGKIIEKTNHRLTEEEIFDFLNTENPKKNPSTTKITFGDEINELLAIVIPNYVTLKQKGMLSSKETYLITLGDDYGFIQEKLSQIYQESIKVKIL